MRRWWIVGLTSLVLVVAMVAAVVAVLAGFGPAPAHAQQGPNQPIPDRPQMISATGTADIPAVEGGQANLPMMLNVGVQQQVAGADTQAAVKAVQDKVAAIKSALIGVGVPAASIQVTSFNMGPVSGPPTPPPPPLTRVGKTVNRQR